MQTEPLITLPAMMLQSYRDRASAKHKATVEDFRRMPIPDQLELLFYIADELMRASDD